MKNEIIYSPVYSKVTLGDKDIYVYKSKIISTAKYSEKSTVSGEIAVTSYGNKAVKIILDAKIFVVQDDFNYIAYFDDALRNEKKFTFEFNGIKITQGRLISASFDSFIESGYLKCEMIFVSEYALKEV